MTWTTIYGLTSSSSKFEDIKYIGQTTKSAFRGKKISDALTGRKLTKESIEKRHVTRTANGGYKFSEEWKKMQSIRVKRIWDIRKGIINVA